MDFDMEIICDRHFVAVDTGFRFTIDSKGIIIDGGGELQKVCSRPKAPFKRHQKWLPLVNFQAYGNAIESEDYLIYVRLHRLGVFQARDALIFIGQKFGESVIAATQPLTFQEYAKIKEIDGTIEYLQIMGSQWDLLPFILEQMRRYQGGRLDYIVFRSIAGSAKDEPVYTYHEPLLYNGVKTIALFSGVYLPISQERATLCLMDLYIPNIWWRIDEEVVCSEVYHRHYTHVTGRP